jgi:hypothetical protein
VVRPRAGITKTGCLVFLLIIAAIGYFGVHFGEVYFRYLEYKDAMKQEMRFRSTLPEEQIKARLQLVADSLGLPPAAGRVRVRKERGQITVEARYTETVEFPFIKKELTFEPRAVGTY